jgi:tetratricopeptide (TPR) repeat protein/transcriptional regulator with XRE-family HTH domain
MTTFGELLRHHRQTAALSQEELAERAGLSPKAVSLLERGQRRFPRRETIEALTTALGLREPDRTALAAAADRPSASATLSQLPPRPATFTGRAEFLAIISGYLSPGGVPHPSVPVLTIDGMAGVGKTALAVRAAYDAAENYPDGQLFIDLHGFTEGVEPEDPATVLARVLRSLGVPGQRIPDTLDQRSALYRTRLAGKRMLIVLDNATSAGQVTPLLPGTAGCAVLTTSRSRLGLAATRSLTVDPLSADEAVALFTELAGPAGRAEDPELVRSVVELCDRLPLAVQIVAARHRTDGLAVLADRLGSPAGSLSELRTGHESVAAVFALSYRQLPAGHQRLFRLISLAPGASLDESAVAAGTDRPLPDIRPALDDLVDEHLLIENEPAVYTFHDLVRAYAASLSSTEDTAADRSAADLRFKTHYAGRATAAMNLLYPFEEQRRPSGYGGTLTTARSAERWLDQESDTLLRIARDDDRFSSYLCGTLHRHLQARGRLKEAESLYRAALATAQQAGELLDVARLLSVLGLILQIRGQFPAATDAFAEALAAAERCGWAEGEGIAALGLGEIDRMSGRHAQAEHWYERTLELSLAAGYPAGEAHALVGLGDIQCTTGRFAEAAASYERGRAVARSVGEDFAAINAGVGLGDVQYDLSRFDQAVEEYADALAVARKLRHEPATNYARTALANAYWKLGRFQEAAELHHQGLQYALDTGEVVAGLNAQLSLAEIHLSSGQPEQARALFEKSNQEAEELGDATLCLRAIQGLGKTAAAQKDDRQAIELFGNAIELADELDQGIDRGRARQRLAAALVGLGRSGEAAVRLEEAVKIFEELGVPELDEAQRALSDLQ